MLIPFKSNEAKRDRALTNVLMEGIEMAISYVHFYLLLFWQIHSLIGIVESAHWKAWLVVLVFITPQIWASYTPRSFYTVYIAHRLNYNTHVLMTSLYYNWGCVGALAVAVNTLRPTSKMHLSTWKQVIYSYRPISWEKLGDFFTTCYHPPGTMEYYKEWSILPRKLKICQSKLQKPGTSFRQHIEQCFHTPLRTPQKVWLQSFSFR